MQKLYGLGCIHICFEIQVLFRSVDRSAGLSDDVLFIRFCLLSLLRFFLPWTAAVRDLKRGSCVGIGAAFACLVCELLAARRA